MADLFITEPVSLRTKRRAFRIEIENPSGGNKSLAYHQEDVQVTSENVSVSSKHAGSLVVPFDTLIATTYAIPDPVTGQTVTFSGAAIAYWLEMDYIIRATAALTPPEIPIL